MQSPFAFGAGGVVSADIAVPDHAKELAFYAAILTSGDSPLWREDLMNSDGTPIIGLGERVPAYEHLPLHWMPHIQVPSVADSVEAAKAAGGKVLLQSDSDDPASQWAGIEDPRGAGFGLIPVVESDAELNHRSGHIASLMLCTEEPAALADFYAEVIGWTPVASEEGTAMQYGGGGVAAEIRDADSNVPSVWLLGLPVADLAESLARAQASGGAVVAGSAACGYAVVCDPLGVCVALQSLDAS